MTHSLEPGDMVKRKSDGHLWVLIDSTCYGNDVHTLHFFSLQERQFLNYTTPFGKRMPNVFEIL